MTNISFGMTEISMMASLIMESEMDEFKFDIFFEIFNKLIRYTESERQKAKLEKKRDRFLTINKIFLKEVNEPNDFSNRWGT